MILSTLRLMFSMAKALSTLKYKRHRESKKQTGVLDAGLLSIFAKALEERVSPFINFYLNKLYYFVKINLSIILVIFYCYILLPPRPSQHPPHTTQALDLRSPSCLAVVSTMPMVLSAFATALVIAW
mgnify:CR=1 FL=1